VTRASRRRLLTRVPAALAALGGLVLGQQLLDPEPASGKRKKHKKRKRKHGAGPAMLATYAPDAEELAFLELLNAYRAQHGLGALTLQDQLGAAAEHHSLDMAEKDYVSHRLSNGDSPMKNIMRFGYRGFTYWGEIIAGGFETADEVLAGWQSSREHNQMMLNGHMADVGIGRAFGANASLGWYWTVTFGRTP
jgi:uncharacterized protein YkwD